MNNTPRYQHFPGFLTLAQRIKAFIELALPALAVLVLLLSIGVSQSFAEQKVYTFGVVPQQSAKKSAQLWTPIFQELSRKTGLNIQFRTAKSIPVFEQRLARGEYDFAYMNPYHYTVFSRDPGYQAIAKRKDQKIRGIIVVKKGSSITELKELQNKKLAFPSPAAFGATVLPQANFRREDIHILPYYVSSHDSVYLSVARGIFAAGGGVKRTLNNISPEIREQLSIFWTTDAYTPHAFASHPNVEPAAKKAVTEALIGLADSTAGKTMLHNLKIKNGIEAARDADWDDVRAIDIDVLANH